MDEINGILDFNLFIDRDFLKFLSRMWRLDPSQYNVGMTGVKNLSQLTEEKKSGRVVVLG